MKRIFRILIGLVLAIVVLMVLAGVLLPVFYDKEDLKQAIAGEVKVRTGRDLSIAGALEFSVFPWLAVEVADLSVSNAEGFGEQPFAKIGKARVGVALVPLLRRQIAVDEIRLDGLELALAVNDSGQNNWDDLTDATSASGNAPDSGESMFSSQRVAGVNIRNARVQYKDQLAGSDYLLSELSVQTGTLGEGKPVPVELSTRLEDVVTGSKAEIGMKSLAAIDLQKQRYVFDNLELSLKFASDGDGGATQAMLIEAPQMVVDLATETLHMKTFGMKLASLEAKGELSASKILDLPAFSGRLTVSEFSPSRLMKELEMEAPVTADPEALQKASFQSTFTGNSSTFNLNDLVLELDQTRFSGELGVLDFDRPKITFDLNADQLDLDRYLEPEPDSGVEEVIAMPNEELQEQEVQGQLFVGQLKMAGLHFSDARVGVTVKNGSLRLNPLTAKFYGGTYNGDIVIDSSGAAPQLSLDEKIDSVTFQKLVADLVDSESLSGLAVGHLRLVGRGTNSQEVLSTLNGELGLTLSEGALEGINIWHEIRTGMAKYKGLELPAPEPNRTVFSRMQMAAAVKDGVVQTRELTAELPFISLSGDGSIDLGQSQVDLGLVARVRRGPELANDPLASELQGKSLPFRITGSLDNPGVALDWEALLKSEATGVLIKKLGLAPSAKTAPVPGEGADDSAAGETDPDAEEPSSEDQVKEAAKGALFQLFKSKDKDKDKEDGGL